MKPWANKLKIGPGGITCTCCTKLSPTKLRKANSRILRRKSKQELRVTNLEGLDV